MLTLGVISNPCSKRNKRRNALIELYEGAMNYKVIFVEADKVSNPDFRTYVEPLRKGFDLGVDVWAINSGDGGQALVEQAIFHLEKEGIVSNATETPISNLLGGTANIRATAAYLEGRSLIDRVVPGSPSTSLDALRKLLNRYGDFGTEQLETVDRHLMQVKTGDREHVGFGFGIGLIPNFYDYYNKHGATHMTVFGLISAGLGALATYYVNPGSRKFIDSLFEKAQADVYVDGVHMGDSFTFLVANSLDLEVDFGPLHFKVKDSMGTNDRVDFRCNLSEDTDIKDIIGQLGNLFGVKKGFEPKPCSIENLVTRDANEIRVVPKSEMGYLVDGECFRTDESISVTPIGPLKYLRV